MMMVGVSTPFSLRCCYCSTTHMPPTKKKKNNNKSNNNNNNNNNNKVAVVVEDVKGNFVEVVRNDLLFLKNRLTKNHVWPKISPQIIQPSSSSNGPPPPPTIPWPQPHYPELSGVDLLMADVKALVAYATYFHCLSNLWWTAQLSELYDPQVVSEYFSSRPHLVVLRLLEVFSSFAVAAIRIRLLGVRNAGQNIDGDVTQYGIGMVLKDTMLNLGPTFIKVGQSLSTRPDIIGSEISSAISELHDQIPPFPRTMAMKIIEEELGCPVEKHFSQMSEEPVAAASFGQVYHCRTVDGLDVAVKVQRPCLRDVVLRDIYILRLGLGLVQKIAKRKNDLRVYADELGKGLVGELDYTLEAANASEFKEAHAPYSFIRVPKVYKHLSRKRVLTMEWIDGESPTYLLNLSTQGSTNYESSYSMQHHSDAKRRLLDMVNHGVEASLVQLLDTGLLHADPHPGNLLYTSSGEIGFLDFGLLCRMQKKHQLAMLASIVHIVNEDWAGLVHDLMDMDVARPGINIRRVVTDLEDALGEVEFKDGVPDVKFSRVLGQIWSVALKYHFRMPPYFTLVLRSLASLEGLAVAADPKFKTFEAAFPFVVQKLLTDNSAASRKILYSVVLNKRKEFQWQKVAMFLRVGTTRKGLLRLVASDDKTSSLELSTNGLFNLTEWVMRFLCSKDGVVMRKLLMTANGASLIRAVVSKEAKYARKSMCMLIAEVIYQWMMKLALGLGTDLPDYTTSRDLLLTASKDNRYTSSTFSPTFIDDCRKFYEDRRLRVILLKILGSAKKEDPVLVLRFCWTSGLMLVTASALAFHQILIALSKAYLGPSGDASFATKGETVRAAVAV